MADFVVDNQSVPATPAAGQTNIFIDSTTKRLGTRDDAGVVRSESLSNFSTASQAPAAATRTYITGSNISVPTNKLQVGTMFRWKFNMTKTAAGVAASTIAVAVGTAGSTADTDRVSFTKPAGTAVVDEGWVDVIVTVRSIGAAGVMVGEFVMVHNAFSAGLPVGHATIPSVVVNTISAGFDMTVANLIVGLTITTGAADAITIQMIQAEAINL